jgi:hypothetical protein
MAKPKPKSPFTVSWRIVSMSAWEDDYLDEEVEAFIEFDDKGTAPSALAESTARWTAA